MKRYRPSILRLEHWLRPLPVLLFVFLVACASPRVPQTPAGMVVLTLEVPELGTQAASDLAPQGIPSDENGNSVVQYLRVSIFDANGNPVTPFDAPAGYLELSPATPSATATLPAGAYTFASFGYDDSNLSTWITYGEDSATLSGNSQVVQIFPQTLLASATLSPSAPISILVPGQQLDLMLAVISPLSPYRVPFADFEISYDLPTNMGDEIASSQRGIRLNVTTNPSTPTFEMSGDASGWRNINDEAVANASVIATVSIPFAGDGNTTIVNDFEPPSLSFDVPATVTVGTPFTLSGSADDNYGVDRVQIYEGPVLIASSHSSDLEDPSVAQILFSGSNWSVDWTLPQSGSFDLLAVAIDSSGNQSEVERTVSDNGTSDPIDPIDPEEPPEEEVTTLEGQLNALGLNTAALRNLPRQIGDGSLDSMALTTAQLSGTMTYVEGDYAPFGMQARLAPKEIFAAGIGSECTVRDFTPSGEPTRVLAINLYDPALASVSPSVQCSDYEVGIMRSPTFGSVPDNGLLHPGTQSTRTVVTGDFDGDGFEDGLVINAWFNDDMQAWWLTGFRYKHGTAFNPLSPSIELFNRSLGTVAVSDVAAVSGDFTGNGLDDVVVALMRNNDLILIPFPQTAAGNFNQSAGIIQNSIDTSDLSGTLSLRMAAGNIDTDPQEEFVVLVRAWGDTLENGQPTGEVRYYIFDHLEEGSFDLTQLESGTLTFTSPESNTTQNVITADVTIGDFDGDGLSEIAFAGIGHMGVDMNTGSHCEDYTYTYLILDDAPRNFAERVNSTHQAGSPVCQNGSISLPGIIYSVIANAIDYNGNYVRELQANERILSLQENQLVEVATVEVHPESGSEQHFSEATVDITVGDVNKNVRENIISYSSYDAVLRFGGLGDPVAPIAFFPTDEFTYPVLEAFDSDLDGTTIAYVRNSHRLEFSEPIILAAMATPPYDVAYGQDPNFVSTSYGTGTSSGSLVERTLSFNTSAGVGVSVGVSFLGVFEFSAEYMFMVDRWIERTAGTAYQTTFTDTYNTFGRDAVVFTAIPYDLYDYEIIASDKPEEVGETLTFYFPRTAYTRAVSTSYFNARVPAGRLKIDERIFGHSAGDVSSYMTLAEKNDLRAFIRNSSNVVSNLFLESGRQTVGEGSTSTSTTIELSQESFNSTAVGVSRTHSTSLTGGVVMTEFSIGEGVENSVTVSSGSSTIVSSEVPGITVDSDTNPDAVYSYGMMTYMQRLPNADNEPGQAFQVINFWVE